MVQLEKKNLEEIDLLTIHPPDKEEIRKNIKKLKNKKTSTDMPAEFLKAAMESESYITGLESLYRETWVDVVVPELWRKTTITPLYKNKGKRKDCKNYSGLSVGSTLLKLAMPIILERLRPWYDKLQNIPSRLNKEVFVLFIDLTAAYDWCVRKWLFHTIFNRIDPANVELINCVKIIEELYKKTESMMKGETTYFETTSGV